MTPTPDQLAEIWREDARRAATHKRVSSILEQAREEGREQVREEHRQSSQCRWDDRYEDGKRDAYAAAPSRLRWFILGATISAVIGYFV